MSGRGSAAIVVGALAVAALLIVAAWVWLPIGGRNHPYGGGVPPENETTVNYSSSVDGFPLSYAEWLPAGFDPNVTYPLAVYLHHIEDTSGKSKAGGFWNQLSADGGGTATIAAAAAAGYLLIAINTRTGSGFYVDSTYTGPQDQDVLDAIAFEKERRHVGDVFLFGFSMGAMGTLYVALHHPSEFAGIGLIETATDVYQVVAHFLANADVNAKAGNGIAGILTTTGGQYPNASAYALSMFNYMTVGRFDPGAYAHLRTYAVEGQLDDVLPNNPSYWPYLQVNDTFLNATCAVASALDEPANCTSPLADLAAANPGEYGFRYVYVLGGGHTLQNLDAADMFAYWSGQKPTGIYWAEVPNPVPSPGPPP